MGADKPKPRPVDPEFWDRDPALPASDTLPPGVKVLDPTSAEVEGVVPRPTAYFARTLLVNPDRSLDGTIALLQKEADAFGWVVEPDPDLQPYPSRLDERPIGISRLTIRGTRAASPDSWCFSSVSPTCSESLAKQVERKLHHRLAGGDLFAGLVLHHHVDQHPARILRRSAST